MNATDAILARVEANLDHMPCCSHEATHYGACTDCMNTGCAHPPYAEGQAEVDLRALVRMLRHRKDRYVTIALLSFGSGATAIYGLAELIGAMN